MIDLGAEIPFLIRAAVELVSSRQTRLQWFSGNGSWEPELMNSKGMMLEPVPGTPACLPVYLLWPWCPWRCGGVTVGQRSSEDMASALCILSAVMQPLG